MDHEALAQSAERRLMEHRRRELGAPPSPTSPWSRTREGPNALAAAATLDRSGASLDVAISAWPSDGLIPGAVVTVTLVVANGGSAGADEIVAVVPAPSGAAYRPGTLMHDGREADAGAEALLGAGLALGKLAGGDRTALTWKLDIGPGIDDLILAPAVRADAPVVAARPLMLGRTEAPSAFKAGMSAELAPSAPTVPTTHEDVETPFYELDSEEQIVETALQSAIDTSLEKPLAAPPVETPAPAAAGAVPAPPAPRVPPVAPIPATGRRIGQRAGKPVRTPPEAAPPVPAPAPPEPAPQPVLAEAAPAPEIIKPTSPRKPAAKPPARRIVKPAATAEPAVAPAPAPVPAAAALYRTLRPGDLGLVEGLLEKPLGLLPHLLFSNLLCVATTGDGADPLGLAAFIDGEATRMGRLKVAARLGKPLPLEDASAAEPAFAVKTAEIRFAEPPATRIAGAVLLRAPLDDSRIAQARAALERPVPRWLAFRLVALVFCAQGLATADAPASGAVSAALAAYAMQARLAFVAFATRMKLDRRLDPTRTATKTLDEAARTTIAALRAAITGDA